MSHVSVSRNTASIVPISAFPLQTAASPIQSKKGRPRGQLGAPRPAGERSDVPVWIPHLLVAKVQFARKFFLEVFEELLPVSRKDRRNANRPLALYGADGQESTRMGFTKHLQVKP